MALRANKRENARPKAMRPHRLRLFSRWSGTQKWSAAAGLLLGSGLAYAYACYLRGGDVSPDSQYGYIFAIAGTTLLALVGAGYALRKRWRRMRFGLLHTALSLHIVGGLVALVLILMHAAGNFHARTGTYALYSLIALVVSGIIGKQLDRVAPRLAARIALRTVTQEGEERLEALVGVLDTKQRQSRRVDSQRRDGHRKSLGEHEVSISPWEPWDLAYYDLDASADEIPSLLHRPYSSTVHPTPSGTGMQASLSKELRQAIGLEEFFLRLIRIWRYLHIMLSGLTLILILWHLEYAATLLFSAR
ncbi:MAG: hypothetical protein C5B60_09070 [Chloroflexi bacterium]|nr:MAG: hypothetical protein C5B60_09070 [Chloroflexota bacterium]